MLYRDGTLGLTLDPQLIRDLTVLITSSTVRCSCASASHVIISNGLRRERFSLVTPGEQPLQPNLTSVQGMGMILESLRQPVINGYLIAGSIVGPGGLQLIKVRCSLTLWARYCVESV
jgi:hypothetical protein